MPKRISQPQTARPADCTIGINGSDGALCIRVTRQENRQLKSFPLNVKVTARSNVPADTCYGLGHTMDFPVPAGTYTVIPTVPASYRGPADVTYEAVVQAGRYTIVQIEIFEDFTIKSTSAAKAVGRLMSRPSVGIAIAGSAARNNEIFEEAKALMTLQQGGVRAVPIENPGLFVQLTGGTIALAAYHMKWIKGLHSKTEKGDFHQALNALAKTPDKQKAALADLDALENFVTKIKNVNDLQLMLEKETGHLYVIDPGGLSPLKPEAEQGWIAKWRRLVRCEETARAVQGGKKD